MRPPRCSMHTKFHDFDVLQGGLFIAPNGAMVNRRCRPRTPALFSRTEARLGSFFPLHDPQRRISVRKRSMGKHDAHATDLQFQIERLEKKHRHLQSEVAEYDRRVYLTSGEQNRLAELKKKKLAAKDALVGLRRDD